jgi:hypothetical protein
VDGYDPSRWNGSKAIKPNVPSSPLLETGAIFYDIDLDNNPATPVYLYEREIYTFEAGADATDKICLVIGGYYKGNSSPTYYCVDFVDEDEDPLSFLRNHSYHVKIKEVLAAGYPSFEEAFDNKPVNMVTGITENEDGIGITVFNERNYLGASAGEITIRRWANAGHQFSVSTDVADGWEVVGTSATSEFQESFDLTWLTVASPGLTVGKGDVTFSVTENDTDAKRVGYIHLVAGRLHLAVKVVQRFVEIWITDVGDTQEIEERVFHSAGGLPVEQQFLLHWVPAGARVDAISIPVSRRLALIFDPAHDTPGALVDSGDPSRERTVTVRPTAMTAEEIDVNPFLEKASRLRFVAFYNDEFASTDVVARHVNHTVADVGTYILDGKVHSFAVRSDTRWEIVAVSDPNQILDAHTPPLLNRSGGDNAAGEVVEFKLVNDDSKSGMSATLTLANPTNLTGSMSVIIRGFACGKNNAAALVPIGKKEYLTHVYGAGSNQRCWMVENSKEGRAYASAYWNGEYPKGDGYYYTWEQANTTNNACPYAWRVPVATEVIVMSPLVNADKNGIGKWWWSIAGYHHIGRNQWMDMNCALWWINVAYYYYWNSHGHSSMTTSISGAPCWQSVRCLQ